MKIYCVVMGEVEQSVFDDVVLELKRAGFKGEAFSAKGVKLLGVQKDHDGYEMWEAGRDSFEYIVRDGWTFLYPSDILNGGAMKLDGAKKVEPKTRWFINTANSKVYETIGRNGYKAIYSNDDLEEAGKPVITGEDFTIWMGERWTSYKELTAEDVAYITDNAEKAKELGYVFRKTDKGDKIIAFNGVIHRPSSITEDFCAGYRYCKKADIVLNGTDQTAEAKTTFCHNYAKPVSPEGSNFCSKCGAKLEK